MDMRMKKKREKSSADRDASEGTERKDKNDVQYIAILSGIKVSVLLCCSVQFSDDSLKVSSNSVQTTVPIENLTVKMSIEEYA